MKSKPYVGVTGVSSVGEADLVVKEFRSAGYTLKDSYHKPMLGFLVSLKTLRDQPVENKRYPKYSDLFMMLVHSQNFVFPMIHYNTQEPSSLSDQIESVFHGVIYGSGLCRALQLNVPWPDVSQVADIKRKFSEMKIVFQLSNKARADRTPQEICGAIKKYGTSIDYVLIDPSGGRGIDFNLEDSALVFAELSDKCPNLSVGFAGGFNGENVERRVTELIGEIDSTNFCIDAEGGLRDKLSDVYGDDVLNRDKVKAYVKNAHKVLD